MTARALAVIAVKIWGVILLVDALASSPSRILFLALPPAVNPETIALRTSHIGEMLNLGLHLLLGIALVLFADRIVRWVVPDGPALRIDVYASELAALGFALVGLYALLQGAGDIAAAVYAVNSGPVYPGPTDPLWYVWERQREAIVRGLVLVAGGGVLMFGRKLTVDAWWWVRGGSNDN